MAYRLRGIYEDDEGRRWTCQVVHPRQPIACDRYADAFELYLISGAVVTASVKTVWQGDRARLKDTGERWGF